MLPSALERLRDEEPLFGVVQTIASVAITRILLAGGAGFVILDREHGEADEAIHARAVASIAEAGALSAVRVHPEDVEAARRYRALGVDLVLMPDVRSPKSAVALVAACADGAGRAALPIAMIESGSGAEAAEAIAATPGLSGIVIGPNDLSREIGQPGDFEAAEFRAAVARIEAAGQAAGLVLGSGVYPGFPAARLLQAGHRFLVVGSDATALGRGLGALIGAAAAARDTAHLG